MLIPPKSLTLQHFQWNFGCGIMRKKGPTLRRVFWMSNWRTRAYRFWFARWRVLVAVSWHHGDLIFEQFYSISLIIKWNEHRTSLSLTFSCLGVMGFAPVWGLVPSFRSTARSPICSKPPTNPKSSMGRNTYSRIQRISQDPQLLPYKYKGDLPPHSDLTRLTVIYKDKARRSTSHLQPVIYRSQRKSHFSRGEKGHFIRQVFPTLCRQE